jgi:hypothetical protein
MGPQQWIESLYIYGPYALLVLFFSAALYLLKMWRQDRSTDRIRHIVYGVYGFLCWGIVIVAAGYIYVKWPPIIIYEGSLGIHEAEPAKFISNSPDLFVKSTPTSDGRLRWQYVVVVRQTAEVGDLDFTYQWGNEKDGYGDYKLELTELKQGHTTLKQNADHKLFYDTDTSVPEKRPVKIADATRLSRPAALAEIFVAPANAQERLRTDILIKWLDSSDPNLRSQARAQLRQLSPADLRQLLSSPGLSDFARQQIEAQLGGQR